MPEVERLRARVSGGLGTPFRAKGLCRQQLVRAMRMCAQARVVRALRGKLPGASSAGKRRGSHLSRPVRQHRVQGGRERSLFGGAFPRRNPLITRDVPLARHVDHRVGSRRPRAGDSDAKPIGSLEPWFMHARGTRRPFRGLYAAAIVSVVEDNFLPVDARTSCRDSGKTR